MSKTYKFEPTILEYVRKVYYPEATQEDVDEINRLLERDWPKHVALYKEWDRRRAMPRNSFGALRNYVESERYPL